MSHGFTLWTNMASVGLIVPIVVTFDLSSDKPLTGWWCDWSETHWEETSCILWLQLSGFIGSPISHADMQPEIKPEQRV